MRTTPFDPWTWVEDRGVSVEFVDMAGTGLWLPGERTVLIDRRGTRRQQHSSLSHECGHIALGHLGRNPRQERQADEWAAVRLISPDGYADAERIVEGASVWAIADELDVAPWVVSVWREVWTRAA